MMSKNGVLVFVVTFMSFIDYSYLSDIVAYPNTTDKNFGEYLMNIDWKGKGKMLRADEFLMVKEHYEFVMKKEYEKPEYAGLIEEISKFPLHNEKRLLRRYMEFDECNITIKKRIEEYIETRKQHYRNKIIKREEEAARKKAEAEEEAERASTEAEEEAERATTKAEGADLLTALGGKKDLEEIETMHGDNQLITLEQQLEEEVQFLESLYELSSNQGRIKNVYLTSVYGSNQHIIHGQMNSIDSVWLHLLRKLDPIFGEKYDSYAFRVISMKKMPLPKEQIPVYYGEGKFYLFDEFDIWPELNSAYIMYYLFNCHLEDNPKYDSSHGVTGPQPTPS